MSGANVNVQDVLLLEWQKAATPVRMRMINGNVIVGAIRRFDRFAILLEANKTEVLIYKHAIASLEAAGEG